MADSHSAIGLNRIDGCVGFRYRFCLPARNKIDVFVTPLKDFSINFLRSFRFVLDNQFACATRRGINTFDDKINILTICEGHVVDDVDVGIPTRDVDLAIAGIQDVAFEFDISP